MVAFRQGRWHYSGGRPRERVDPRSDQDIELWDQLDEQLELGQVVEVKFSDKSIKTIKRVDDKIDLIVDGVLS